MLMLLTGAGGISSDDLEITSRIALGVFGLGAGGFILTASEGLFVDSLGKRVRKYTTTFGLKRGKWVEVGGYSQITIMSNRASYNKTMKGVSPTSFTQMLYKVFILNKNHTRKFMLYTSTSMADARTKLAIIGKELSLEEADYAPPKVKNRR